MIIKGLHQALERIREEKVTFFLVYVGVFTVTFGFLYVVDFLPEKPEETRAGAATSTAVAEEEIAGQDSAMNAGNTTGAEDPAEPMPPLDPTPDRIIIDKLDREVAVLNPETRTVAGLDAALLEGVVRHPDSADFQESGTMFLFGHSSYLPKVINKNFQAFNGIQDLTWGDTVRVQSQNMEYVYRVDRVYQVRASEADVEIERGEPKLVLSTCNTFGSKDDRYIVEATQIDAYPIEMIEQS